MDSDEGPIVLLFDVVAPSGDLADADAGDGLADLLRLVERNSWMDSPRVSEYVIEPDFVARPDLGVQEMQGGVLGLAGSLLVGEGEIEEKEEFPARMARAQRLRAAFATTVRRVVGSAAASGAAWGRCGGQHVPLEIGDRHGPAVILDDEVALGQVEDRLSLCVGDIDLDELEDDADLVFERLGRPDGLLIVRFRLDLAGGEGRGDHGQSQDQPDLAADDGKKVYAIISVQEALDRRFP